MAHQGRFVVDLDGQLGRMDGHLHRVCFGVLVSVIPSFLCIHQPRARLGGRQLALAVDDGLPSGAPGGHPVGHLAGAGAPGGGHLDRLPIGHLLGSGEGEGLLLGWVVPFLLAAAHRRLGHPLHHVDLQSLRRVVILCLSIVIQVHRRQLHIDKKGPGFLSCGQKGPVQRAAQLRRILLSLAVHEERRPLSPGFRDDGFQVLFLSLEHLDYLWQVGLPRHDLPRAVRHFQLWVFQHIVVSIWPAEAKVGGCYHLLTSGVLVVVHRVTEHFYRICGICGMHRKRRIRGGGPIVLFDARFYLYRAFCQFCRRNRKRDRLNA